MFPPAARPPLPLLITGIAGVAGYHALGYFQRRYPGQVYGIRQADNARCNGPGVIACNAEDSDGLARLFDQYEFASVLNCAGNCALRACELDPALARRINVEGVRNLLSQTVPRGVRLVHLSVDLVFSGERDGGYLEHDSPDPVTMYGKTMVVGEQLVREADPAACTLRISLPMGISLNGHAGAIDWITSRFKKSRPATLYVDEVRTPTYTDCLSALCEVALGGLSRFSGGLSQFSSDENGTVPFGSSGFVAFRSAKAAFFRGAKGDNAPVIDLPLLAGLFHAGGPRRLSLYQTAQIINRVGGYDPDCLIGIPRREAGPLPPRAGNVAMDSSKLVRALGYNPFDPWPLDDRLVPTDPDWHRQRPPGEPRSPEYLHQVLCNNPARRRSPFLPIGALA